MNIYEMAIFMTANSFSTLNDYVRDMNYHPVV